MIDIATRALIQSALVKLALPLSKDERRDGWSTAAKAAMHASIAKLINAETSPLGVFAIHIPRAADHWGVLDGELLEAISLIANRVYEANRNA